jgi:cyclic pyranopterin phosphate synthase
MPEDMTFQPDERLLQSREISRLAGAFARLGFRKIRFTGGEPTLRADVVDIVRDVAQMPGVQTVAMTTNAIRLKTLARPLKEAGLRRVNISIDSLKPETFQRLTRWGRVEDVWEGLDAAEQAELEIKLNAVVIRGMNDQEDVVELARLTLNRPWQVRFIEMMPFGEVAEFQTLFQVDEEILHRRIENTLGPLELLYGGSLDGEARIFRLPDAKGTVGFISSVSKPFCAGCNRVRLTADGALRLCLLRDNEVDLRTPLRAGADDAALERLISQAVYDKPWGHGLAEDLYPKQRVMSEIGG